MKRRSPHLALTGSTVAPETSQTIARLTVCLALMSAAGQLSAAPGAQEVASARQAITTDDLIALRDIDAVSVSPDGHSFVVLVRQADVAGNRYAMSWLVGSVEGGDLRYIGDGGAARLALMEDGGAGGDFAEAAVRWCPDGTSVAYTVSKNGEVQIWVSDVATGVQHQITHNAADVHDFAWTRDCRRLVYSVGAPRADLRRMEEAADRSGINLQDYWILSSIIQDVSPPRLQEQQLQIWSVDRDSGKEELASHDESASFARGHGPPQSDGTPDLPQSYGMTNPPSVSENGSIAWVTRITPHADCRFPDVRLTVSRPGNPRVPIVCTARECTGKLFKGIWWSSDNQRVNFLKLEGDSFSTYSFYSWSVGTGRVRALLSSDDDSFRRCDSVSDIIVCVREQPTRPDHIVTIDSRTAHIAVVADVNPGFQQLQLARVERITWDVPAPAREWGYTSKGRGFIVFPPGFDPHQKYPVFVAPYSANGFIRGDVGDEQPMLVYAADGLIVLNLEFPYPIYLCGERAQLPYSMGEMSAAFGFPRLQILANSTIAGLNHVARRGFLDLNRVGMGGVSHGTFIPLFILQRDGLLSALSISGNGWSQDQYYLTTHTGREKLTTDPRWPESTSYWSQIDISDHIDRINAPILFHNVDEESLSGFPRLQRRLDDAHKPFDAYVFTNETHLKWQPAHRYAIYNRNVDWFRFWLQGYEDSDPTKAEQYRRWEKLCDMQFEQNPHQTAFCVRSKTY